MIQNPLAGNHDDYHEVHHKAQDSASLLEGTFPVAGDYRKQPYRALLDEAVDRIKTKLFDRAENNYNALGVATCCNSWGEVRSLASLGHPADRILKYDNRKAKTKLTRDNIKAKILGPSPDDWSDEPWEVKFPKLLVPCTLSQDRSYVFRVEAAEPPQEDAARRREATESLGKRDASELKTLPFESTMDGR